MLVQPVLYGLHFESTIKQQGLLINLNSLEAQVCSKKQQRLVAHGSVLHHKMSNTCQCAKT